MRRSRLLFDVLMRRQPALGRILTLSQLGASTGPVVVIAAFVLGLLTNALGPERRINLLALPLIGLLSWNLAAYVLLAIWTWSGRGRDRPGPAERLSGYLFRGALRRRLHSSRIVEEGRTTESRIITKAVMRFGAMWHRLAGRLLAGPSRSQNVLAGIALRRFATAGSRPG